MVLWLCGEGGRGEQASWLGDWDDLMDWVSGAVSGGYFDTYHVRGTHGEVSRGDSVLHWC